MPNNPQRPPAAGSAKVADEIGWRRFPRFESLFESGDLPEMLERFERTCRQLDVLTKSDSEEIRSRAQAALDAYGRALELIREIDETRTGMGEQAK